MLRTERSLLRTLEYEVYPMTSKLFVEYLLYQFNTRDVRSPRRLLVLARAALRNARDPRGSSARTFAARVQKFERMQNALKEFALVRIMTFALRI